MGEVYRDGKKLTDEKAGIYGAYNPDWVHYNYMYAMQKGFSHYKEDGTSNYDDPLFKESVNGITIWEILRRFSLPTWYRRVSRCRWITLPLVR